MIALSWRVARTGAAPHTPATLAVASATRTRGAAVFTPSSTGGPEGLSPVGNRNSTIDGQAAFLNRYRLDSDSGAGLAGIRADQSESLQYGTTNSFVPMGGQTAEDRLLPKNPRRIPSWAQRIRIVHTHAQMRMPGQPKPTVQIAQLHQ